MLMHQARAIAAVSLLLAPISVVLAEDISPRELAGRFKEEVQPFLKAYCFDCHGDEKPEAELHLTRYASLDAVRADFRRWETVLERLAAEEMPPEDAKKQPTPAERQSVIEWIRQLRNQQAERGAGDPGPVLPRRLSNAEYDYTIRDLTDVDIRPTREFPIDPANEAGFDNSGESLTMSPELLKKYLAAARHVADHLVLLPDGFTFAPHRAVIYSDRDKFCVARIIDFYRRQRHDYADFFLAAWKYHHRDSLGEPHTRLSEYARRERISAKYLRMIHALLTGDDHDSGPIAELRAMWRKLPENNDNCIASARRGCEEMRDFVVSKRAELVPPAGDFKVDGINPSSQPRILWMNRELSANRRRGKLPESDGQQETERLRAAIARFCSLFPDTFVVSERGRMFLEPEKRNKGRLLSAGFHLMVGYYRDDAPLYDLILNDKEQRELDRLWEELDFVTHAPTRQVQDFVYFERAESPGYLKSAEFDFAREDKDVTSPEKLRRLAKAYVAKARRSGLQESYISEIERYFAEMSARLRHVERARAIAEPSHLDALLDFAQRAWRRPLTAPECEGLLSFYRELRVEEKLSHEDALRDVLVSVLLSPHFCYRIDVPADGRQVTPLSNYALASRLSYFLWSSMPDEELVAHAESGDLRDAEVLLAQTRRMLKDPRVRGLATEFAGHWLGFRDFPRHTGVNRQRFTTFTDELQQAMFEEPVRFFVDLVERDGSVFEFLDGTHTFVNAALGEHYGIPFEEHKSSLPNEEPDPWVRVDAAAFGRGGVLPMAVFLTKHSPGLRTSPVKRGYWVVRQLLGEQIPAPPPEVPELPGDEAKLGDLTLRQVLARHREIKSCAACHERFDSVGLIFEGYGPIGERRTEDLGGRPVDTQATFPDGNEGDGLEGLRRYLSDRRRDEFVGNLCRKLLAYALGRRPLLSDQQTIDTMKSNLAHQDGRITSLIEAIVASPQFLNQRGRDFDAASD
jgi:hypothetical protein